jgi:hypothetical protein
VLGDALIELRQTSWPYLDVSTELVLSKLNEIRLLYQDLEDGGGAAGSMRRAECLATFLRGLAYVGYPVYELSASNFAKFFDEHPPAVCVVIEALIKARCDALFFQQALPKLSRLGLKRSGEEPLIEPEYLSKLFEMCNHHVRWAVELVRLLGLETCRLIDSVPSGTFVRLFEKGEEGLRPYAQVGADVTWELYLKDWVDLALALSSRRYQHWGEVVAQLSERWRRILKGSGAVFEFDV